LGAVKKHMLSWTFWVADAPFLAATGVLSSLLKKMMPSFTKEIAASRRCASPFRECSCFFSSFLFA
jgi:hypothetical protein